MTAVKALQADLVGPLPLTDEEWRAYTWKDPMTGQEVTWEISHPQALYYRKGGSTHRVVNEKGETFVLPAPGYYGCVLSWYAPTAPVSF